MNTSIAGYFETDQDRARNLAETTTLGRGYANTRQQKRRLLTVQKFATLAPESMPRKVRRQIARDVMKREWKAAK